MGAAGKSKTNLFEIKRKSSVERIRWASLGCLRKPVSVIVSDLRR